jgi:mRNA-degrading endonuclease toxin of MazEF toxin-antitoxin module
MMIKQVEELVLQSLEHEKGGVQIYTVALTCAVNSNLKKEWQKYLDETQSHVTALEQVCRALDIDAQKETPGRAVVRHVGQSLVAAMKMALTSGEKGAAQLVACECVVLAETKDHMDWELMGKCAEHLPAAQAKALKAAYDEIEDQEDEHLYHTKGWCRELWLESLGMKAVLPPPEERRKVKTAIGAARAEQAAEKSR